VGGGNIYNFKTILIASGSTLRLSGAVFPNPLYFLAQGTVIVYGTIDVSGQAGYVPTASTQRTGPTTPGAGGYGGGSASYGANAALPGMGPNGGTANVNGCFPRPMGGAGGVTVTSFAVPLVGGSGGGGTPGSAAGVTGANGGAGGGGLLIASSVSIAVYGTITAAGGAGGYSSPNGSGGGAGGTIRLVAPTITGGGTLNAAGGAAGFITGPCTNAGANGVVRIEAFQNSYNGQTAGMVYTASPVGLFLPSLATLPSISVTSINGIAVPASPTGSFTVPDVLLNSTSPLTVTIHASNIPLGTVPTIYFYTENYPDQTIAASAGLAGTLGSSTATATVTLNPGYSIGLVTANWSQ
jgi:hypothetical protein